MATPPTGTLTGDLGDALGGSPSGAGTLWLTPPQVVGYPAQGYTLQPKPIAVSVSGAGILTPTAVARTDQGVPAGWAYDARVDVPGLPPARFKMVMVASSQDIAAGIVSRPGEPSWLPTTTPHAHDDLYPSRSEVTSMITSQTSQSVAWTNVTTYGAVGDGVTDDTSAIVSAMNAAGPEGVVFLPRKTFLVSSTLTIPKTQEWVGFGPNQNTPGSTTHTRIKYVGTGPAIIAESSDISRIRIDGPGAGSVGSVGIKLIGAGRIRDCSIYDFETALSTDQCWYAVIESVFVRYCGTAAKLNYSYNVSLSDFRASCAQRAASTYGAGIVMTDRCMVTMHGGSIEHYTVGVKIDGGNQSLTATGLYQESYSPGAIGVQLVNGQSTATLIGSQVYLDNHDSWIHAGAGTAGGSSVNGMGNKFKSGAAATGTTYAYFIGGTTALSASGDDWGGIVGTGYVYRNLALGGPGIVADPVGTTTPGGMPGGGVALGGSGPITIENNRALLLSSGGLPASPRDGDIRIDPADGKLKYRWGGAWRVVTSS